MSNPGEGDATPITAPGQLVAWFEAGCRPRSDWGIGTEHEKFPFRIEDLSTPDYATGIRPLLEGVAAQGGWAPIEDRGNIIGLKGEGANKGASVSLEPAGQFELSGAILSTLHETESELDRHFAAIRPVAERLGLDFAMLGFHPLATREASPWMPKGRYAIMRRYMPTVGGQGLDMMLRTCTVQVNLDYGSEADMVEKLRLSLALQPIATALFANSPFREGRDTGFASFRSQVWTDTDPDRTGIPAVVFEDGFGFARYVDWLLDVPMYFVYRNGTYHDVAGKSFRDFMAGRLEGFEGQLPTMGDFADHVTTVFTEVRLKKFLEMRGADSGPPAMLAALPALWVGLLYDDAAQKAAWSLVRERCPSDIFSLRGTVPRMGLSAPWCGHTARELARDVLTIAEQGLRARARPNPAGEDETRFLAPLWEIVESGQTYADRWRAASIREWHGEVGPVMQASALFGQAPALSA